MFLIIFGIEEKVYPFFGGTINFIVFGSVITFIICFLYYYTSKKKIKQKNKLSKNIGIKIYSLMKLENE